MSERACWLWAGVQGWPDLRGGAKGARAKVGETSEHEERRLQTKTRLAPEQ